jgi:hypothetical protein
MTLSDYDLSNAILAQVDTEQNALSGWGDLLVYYLHDPDGQIRPVLQLSAKDTGVELPQLTASYSSSMVAERQQLLASSFNASLEAGHTLTVGKERYTHQADEALCGMALAETIAALAEGQGWDVEVSASYGLPEVSSMTFTSTTPGIDQELLPISYTSAAVSDKTVALSGFDGIDAAPGLSLLENMDVITGFAIGQDKIRLPSGDGYANSIVYGKLDHGELAGLSKEDFVAKAAEMDSSSMWAGEMEMSGLYHYGGDAYLLVGQGGGMPFDPASDIVIKLAGVTAEEAANATVENLFFTGVI